MDIIHTSMTFSGIEQIFSSSSSLWGGKFKPNLACTRPRSCTTYIISIKETQHKFCQTSILYT